MRRRSQYTVHLQPKLVSNHKHTSKAISKTFSKLMKDIGLIDGEQCSLMQAMHTLLYPPLPELIISLFSVEIGQGSGTQILEQ